MSRLLDDREHAAENLFVHDEELNFLAHRRGIEVLAAWASESLQLDDGAAARYESRLVDAFVGGTREEQILLAVQTDLERGGKPALSTTAGAVLAQATSQAVDELHGRAPSRVLGRRPENGHAYLPIGASLSWRG